jgi:hypothetical protein
MHNLDVNPHPDLRFTVTGVSFLDAAGMGQDLLTVSAEEKKRIIARWTPLIGRVFAHTWQFPPGVRYVHAWISEYDHRQEKEFLNNCPHCRRWEPPLDRRRTT